MNYDAATTWLKSRSNLSTIMGSVTIANTTEAPVNTKEVPAV